MPRVSVLASFAAACVASVGLSASAGEFAPPSGCESFLTVQFASCKVKVYYRCEADPAGSQWAATFTANGHLKSEMLDAQANWATEITPNGQIESELGADSIDLASLNTLLTTGYDDWDFTQHMPDGSILRYQGYDRLIGETVVIDGVTLQRTEVDFTETDEAGRVRMYQHGNEYVSDQFRRFFGGVTTAKFLDGQIGTFDQTPRDFIYPGEPGFGATVPLYGCGGMLSSLSLGHRGQI